MLMARCPKGLRPHEAAGEEPGSELASVRAVFFLLGPKDDPGAHLRLLGHLATRVEDASFMPRWEGAATEAELKATLLETEGWLTVHVGASEKTLGWVGQPLRALELPEGTLVVYARRRGQGIVPGGSTILEEGDRLTVIGDPPAIRRLAARTSGTARIDDGAEETS